MNYSDWQREIDDRRSCDWRWQRADPAAKGQLLTTSPSDDARRFADSYGVQCVLIAQLDFDIWGAYKNDQWTVSVYSDRLPYGQLRAIHERHGGKGDWYDGLSRWSKERLLAFVADVCRLEWCGGCEGVEGFRLMRHTNVSSGYPVYTVEAHGKSKSAPASDPGGEEETRG